MLDWARNTNRFGAIAEVAFVGYAIVDNGLSFHHPSIFFIFFRFQPLSEQRVTPFGAETIYPSIDACMH